MKKEYIKPAIEIVEVETENIMASSITFSDDDASGLAPIYDDEEAEEDAW